MDEQLLVKLQVGGNLVGHGFGRMEMTEIKTEGEVAAEGVVGVELLGTHDVFLAAEAEEFSLDGIDAEFAVDLGVREDGVIGITQTLARSKAIGRDVLGSVGNPVIVDAGAFQFFGKMLRDAATGVCMVDPELAHLLVAMGQGVTIVGQWMGKIGRIEIETDLFGLGPIQPTAEVAGFEGIALHDLFAGLGIKRMQVEALFAGKQIEDL